MSPSDRCEQPNEPGNPGWLAYSINLTVVVVVVPALMSLVFRLFGVHRIADSDGTSTKVVIFGFACLLMDALWAWGPAQLVMRWDLARPKRRPGRGARTLRGVVGKLFTLGGIVMMLGLLAMGAFVLYNDPATGVVVGAIFALLLVLLGVVIIVARRRNPNVRQIGLTQTVVPQAQAVGDLADGLADAAALVDPYLPPRVSWSDPWTVSAHPPEAPAATRPLPTDPGQPGRLLGSASGRQQDAANRNERGTNMSATAVPSLLAHWLVRLDGLNGRTIEWSPRFEVSVDCVICTRCHRTVVMVMGELGGDCISGRRTIVGPHRVESSVDNWRTSTGDGDFMLEMDVTYRYAPFTDSVDGYPSDPTSDPWIRVYYVVTCANCANVTGGSTQSNLVRPYVLHCKTCGAALVADVTAPVWTIRRVDALPR